MKRLGTTFAILATFLFASSAIADIADTRSDVDETDIQALREWIYSKRQVTVGEKGGALSISGEVRVEFQTNNETKNGVKQRGGGAPLLGADGDILPAQMYDIEVNLMFDYRTDRTWASVKLEFDNDAGLFGGSFNKLKLERAFLGVRILEKETYTSDIIMGRNRMGSFFDSKVEFGTFFDGILFRYDQSNDKIGDYYLHAGVFLIDDRRNHYGYVGEIGILNIANTGFYWKYSCIDWDTKHYPSHHKIDVNGKLVEVGQADNARFDFVVSQMILGYKFVPKWLKKTTLFYAAALVNSEAKKRPITNNTKANWAGYVGFSMGELRKKNDWAFDANYQAVQAQAIPEFDNNGIGIGNSDGSGFYVTRVGKTPLLNTVKTAGGNVNYRGFVLTLEYLLTNNINLFQQWQQSVTLNDHIGPFRRFKQYEIEFIYLF
jgi:hypothetical protein